MEMKTLLGSQAGTQEHKEELESVSASFFSPPPRSSVPP